MGGPATGLLSPPPTGEPMPGMPGMQHSDAAARDTAHLSMPGMVMPPAPNPSSTARDSATDAPSMPGMVMPNGDGARSKLFEAMLRDPVIDRRIQAVPALRRLRREAGSRAATPAGTAALRQSERPPAQARQPGAARRDTATVRPKPMPPMPGMKHP